MIPLCKRLTLINPLSRAARLPLLIGVLLLSGCAGLFLPLQFLPGRAQTQVLVSEQEPHPEYQCRSLGFLPCTLGDTPSTPPAKGREYLQCAQNLLSFAEKMGTNYMYIAAPVKVLGINWRDSKANLYDCQFLPQPSRQGGDKAPSTSAAKPDITLPASSQTNSDPANEVDLRRKVPLSKR